MMLNDLPSICHIPEACEALRHGLNVINYFTDYVLILYTHTAIGMLLFPNKVLYIYNTWYCDRILKSVNWFQKLSHQNIDFFEKT